MTARRKSEPIRQPKLLIAEGTHDVAFLESLLQWQGMAADWEVRDMGGKTLLAGDLDGLRNRPEIPKLHAQHGYLRFGIVRDADRDPQAAFESVAGALRGNAFPAPTRPLQVEPGQLVLRDGTPLTDVSVAVFIAPGTDRCGALESLCMESVAEQAVAKCVDSFVRCVREQAQRDIPAHRLEKVRAHAFIAGQMDNPDLHMGTAAEAGCWPFGHEAFAELKAFIRELGQA